MVKSQPPNFQVIIIDILFDQIEFTKFLYDKFGNKFTNLTQLTK